jgi:hypothetical protein
MRVRLSPCIVGFCLCYVLLLGGEGVYAQTPPRIALKSGESAELHLVYFVRNCTSIVVGTPEVEVLEGPAELTLAIKPGMVLPRVQNCAKPVQGGTLIVTAKDVAERKQATLTYRIRYKTKEGDRQQGGVYNVSLFP